MAKRCTVCNKNFPDELNYCPQCGAWAETPGTPRSRMRPDRPSSGDFVIDPMQPNPPSGSLPEMPASGDFVIDPAQSPPPGGPRTPRPTSGELRIDPMQPDPPSGTGLDQPSQTNGDDVIEIDWEEIETPAAGGPPKGPPPTSTPTPPQAPPIMAGWQTVPPAKPAQPGKADPDRASSKSSSGDFELPPESGDELIPVEPETRRPVSAEDINIDDLLADDGGSEVRLAPRSGAAPGWEDEAFAPDDSAVRSHRLEEPSAVNLAALAGDSAGDSGDRLVTAETIRSVSQPAAKPRRGGSGWIGGGLVGAALATAACVALWFSGTLDGLRGTTTPATSSAQRPAEPLTMPPTDSTAQATIDQLQAANDSLRNEKQKTDVQLATLVKDLEIARQAKPEDAAALAALDNLKKENESLLADKKKTEGQIAAFTRMLIDAKYITDQQPNVEAGLTKLLKDFDVAKNTKPDDATARAALDKLKMENDTLLNDKKKTEGQIAAVEALLKESKYVTDQQTDVVKGVDALIKDQKKSGDAPAVLAAVTNSLRAGNYVTAEQSDVAKGLEKLLADKQAAEKNFADATATLKNVDTTSKDAAVKIKAAEDQAKDAAARLNTANQAVEDTTAKLRNSDATLQVTNTKLKAANATLQDVASALAAAQGIAPDPRSQALVRGIEQLAARVRSAPTNGATGRNGAATRPSDVTTPSDPLGAERHYVRGLSNFWGGRYWAAETDFFDAIRSAGTSNPDARYYYFLGLTQLAQGKSDESRAMFKMASSLEEQRKPPGAVVSKALERVQGRYRTVVENYRP